MMHKAQSGTKTSRARRLGIRGLLPLWLSLCALPLVIPARALGQAAQPPKGQTRGNGASTAQANGAPSGAPEADANAPGTISGTILFQAQAVEGAKITLTRDDSSATQETTSGEQGQFLFSSVAPGPFHIRVEGEGFETQSVSGTLRPGDTFFVPQISLVLATVVTEVKVLPPQVMAEQQIHEEEKQRVLGVIPNFYVSYLPPSEAVALTSKQKFELAWKSSVDPITFAGIAFIAAFQQAGDSYPEWGQGWGAYGERYGAFYANVATGTFLGDAVMPSLLKQDPRYFYRGAGSKKSRLLHALGAPFVCPGDNGRQEVNYSYLIGSFAAGGISTLYYPMKNHTVAGLTFENGFVRIAENSISSVAQEFVIRKLTPRRHRGVDPPDPPPSNQ
ncbi:MAG TPA: carboxypeptidase-like regulatory domain-containing protein [Candidatus Acidoferrales bacterium]|nr:carboxypeptidase-like regulatory domain-containing protein [Candidatus Acidoferrales bacterium]